MLFVALATDYDGTLAHDGRVDPAAIEALTRLRAAGKRLLLITGREWRSLHDAFEQPGLFDVIVAENGALLVFPATREERLLAAPPPPAFLEALVRQGVEPLSIGRGIVATWTPNEGCVLKAIREAGIDWQIIFNKGAVMCLAPGINKASGMAAALEALNLAAANVVGVGDAENDLAFLAECGCAVAVANALEPVKAMADHVTTAAHGAGVAELATRWLDDPTQAFAFLRRHDVLLGDVNDGTTAQLSANRGAILIAGSSGAGKSRLTRLVVERLVDARDQVCIVDPEGDYGKLERFVHLGDEKHTPSADEVLGILNAPGANLTLNLLGTEIADRPAYFNALVGRINSLRMQTGRPHWLVLDEGHHLMPRSAASAALPADPSSILIITTHPENLADDALRAVSAVIAVGDAAPRVLESFAARVGAAGPEAREPPKGRDEVLYWILGEPRARTVTIGQPRQQHQRHTRKYAEGRLGEDLSFYFRGRLGALNLRAYNLATFVELANGVDDETWAFHLERGDYTRWFGETIKDPELADEIAPFERFADPAASRVAIFDAIKRRYALLSTP